MRSIALITVTTLIASGCGSTTYEIPRAELARLATLPPETRGEHVRVVEQLSDTDVGFEQPVTANTQLVLFPDFNVYGPTRAHYFHHPGNVSPRFAAHGGGGHFGGGGGGGGDGRGYVVAILVAAAVILFADGARFDGFAQLHPMHPVHLFGVNGGYAVLPLAWIDPQTAAWTARAVIHDTEGPWHPLERAPLDRAGWTYAMFGGVGTLQSVDGTKALGTTTTIQLGIFPTQTLGILGSVFFGWRDDSYGNTLLESRYTLEVDDYVAHSGPLHLGFYAGGGSAYRWEDSPIGNGDTGSLALLGGAQLQLEFNTRLAITARLGETYAHGDYMTDALIGLAVY
jgi:hypothetical protein